MSTVVFVVTIIMASNYVEMDPSLTVTMGHVMPRKCRFDGHR